MGVRIQNAISPTYRWIWSPYAYRNLTTQTTTAGTVYLALVEIPTACVVDGIQILNFATIAGNITVGLYKVVTEDDATNSILVAESASTALAGANLPQFIAFSSAIALSAGRYYTAIELSDATHTLGGGSLTGVLMVTHNQSYARGGGYGALTNPCPAVTNTVAFKCGLLRVKA